MKYVFIYIAVANLFFLISCGGSSKTNSGTADSTSATNENPEHTVTTNETPETGTSTEQVTQENSSSGSKYKYEDLYVQYQKDFLMGEGNKKMDGDQVMIEDKITGVTEAEEMDGTKFIKVGFGKQSADEYSDYKVAAHFRGAEAEKVRLLKAGDKILLEGKIKDYKFKVLTLENCSIK